MNTETRFFELMNNFRATVKESMGCGAEKWLDIAFKLVYISLEFKEKIDTLIKKVDEMQNFNAKHQITEGDIEDMAAVSEIAVNTRFSLTQLATLNC